MGIEQLETYILEFQEWALFEGAYSMSTIKRDSRKIRELSKKFDVLNPTIESVRNYFLDKLHEGKVQRSTLNVTRKALMKWFRFLKQMHALAVEIKIPKQSEKRSAISWIPTNEEVKRIIQAADIQSNREVAARDGAVMRLLFSGGLRIGEVVKLNLQDMRSSGIFVHSEKGGRMESWAFQMTASPVYRNISYTGEGQILLHCSHQQPAGCLMNTSGSTFPIWVNRWPQAGIHMPQGTGLLPSFLQATGRRESNH